MRWQYHCLRWCFRFLVMGIICAKQFCWFCTACTQKSWAEQMFVYFCWCFLFILSFLFIIFIQKIVKMLCRIEITKLLAQRWPFKPTLHFKLRPTASLCTPVGLKRHPSQRQFPATVVVKWKVVCTLHCTPYMCLLIAQSWGDRKLQVFVTIVTSPTTQTAANTSAIFLGQYGKDENQQTHCGNT